MYTFNPFTKKPDFYQTTYISGSRTFTGLTDTPESFTNNRFLLSSATDIGYSSSNLTWDNSTLSVSGSLGVGTQSPLVKFHVYGDNEVLGDTSFFMGPNHTINSRSVYGGLINTVCQYSVCIGNNHTIGTDDASIFGGYNNSIDAPIEPASQSVIVSGMFNSITSSGTGAFHNNLGRDFIGSGQNNTINILCDGDDKGRGIILGGDYNTVTGDHGVVLGGSYNEVSGGYSIAAGYKAKSKHQGSFVWADYTADSDFESITNDEFAVRAAGGIRLVGDITTSGVFNMPSNPPATSSGVGVRGDIAWDASYFYVCIADNTWKRASLSSW